VFRVEKHPHDSDARSYQDRLMSDLEFSVGSIVACWHLTEDPVLVTHIRHMNEYTTTSGERHPAGERIVGKSFRQDGTLHEF
jgi:hypothetical protein